METPKVDLRIPPEIPVRRIVQIAAAVLALAMIAGLCISISMYRNIQKDYASARGKTGEAIYQNLYMLLRKNDELSLAGADIQGTVLPAMRDYFLAAKALNELIADAYGEKYAVFTADQTAALENAFATYAAAFKSGKSTDEAQGILAAALQEVESLLLERYDETGMLLPAA